MQFHYSIATQPVSESAGQFLAYTLRAAITLLTIHQSVSYSRVAMTAAEPAGWSIGTMCPALSICMKVRPPLLLT